MKSLNNKIIKIIENMNLTGSLINESSAKSNDKYIPKMINIDAIMGLEEKEREVLLSFITSDNGAMRNEIRVMLETKGIFIDKPQ